MGSLSETPGPTCGVTEMGVMPWTVGRLATAGGGLGAATPGEPAAGPAMPGEPTAGVVPVGYAAGGGGGMPGMVGRSEGFTAATPCTVGRLPTGSVAGFTAAGGGGGRRPWAGGAPGAAGRGAAWGGPGCVDGMAPEDMVRGGVPTEGMG